MLPLNYLDLYRLTEELQQLVGGQLQAVFNPNPLRYVLEIRQLAQSRNLFIDLTPTKPFIVSTSFTKTKSLGKKTPVYNFLKAHFSNLRIEKIEIAQKPNRTLRLVFTGGAEITFKCFPHGQHLILKAADKFINFPLRPKNKDEEPVTFIDPENSKLWDVNEDLTGEALKGTSTAGTATGSTAMGEPYHLKILKKLEKAVATIEKGMAEQKPLDLERIEALEKRASESQGEEIQGIFEEIKRIKRKATVSEQRRQDLLNQIEKIKIEPSSAPLPKQNLPKPKKGEAAFSGTRVRISENWELWVGRNAWQNDDLLRLGSSHELWFHLRDYPGAHGILRGPKKAEPTPTQVELAARIVAILSQSKKKPFSEGEKLDFIITPKKFVRKRKGDAPGRVTVEREVVRRIAFKSIKFEVI
jgi:predicted ribosome quality control (RQC) complex YloA/Tae2 family protein